MWSCWCRPTAGSGCRMQGIHPLRLTTPRPKLCLHDATRNKNVWVMPSLTSNFEAVLLYYTTKSEVSSTSSTFLPSPPTPRYRRRCRCCCRRRTRRQTSFTLGPSSVASRYRERGARCRHSPILHCCFPLLMRYYYTVLHTIAAGVHMSTNTTVIN